MSREYQLLRSTAKPGHPFTQFGTGNFTTLHDMPNADHINVRATVPTILWHSKHVWPCDWTQHTLSSAPRPMKARHALTMRIS
jgi:secreted Zn-dependent insulinase-like peptidase